MNQRRILIVLGRCDRRLQRGIERYAVEHRWQLSAPWDGSQNLPWGWTGDGILTRLDDTEELAEFIAATGVPAVDFTGNQPGLKIPRVTEDHAQAARLVAGHFLARRLDRHFFYSHDQDWSGEECGRHFIRLLKQAGRQCTWLRWRPPPAPRFAGELWNARRQWLALRLQAAPKPVAVFAANDHQAQEVFDACEFAGWEVPEEVVIVGAGNYLPAPDALRVPLSSVDTDWETIGWRGARLLDELMNGRRLRSSVVRVPARGLVERRSSEPRVNDKNFARSLRLLQVQLGGPLSVADVAGAAAMSAPALRKAFRQYSGRTPREELRWRRVERGKRLLVASNHGLKTIAGLCGYQSARSFAAAFLRLAGMRPDDFRRQSRAGPAGEAAFLPPGRDGRREPGRTRANPEHGFAETTASRRRPNW